MSSYYYTIFSSFIFDRSFKILLFIHFILPSLLINAQSFNDYTTDVFRERDLVSISDEWFDNQNLLFERLVAYNFNKIINDYRISKGLHAMHWEERLWLASRNHNVFMSHNNILSHGQSKLKDFYTGSQPKDRVRFVCHQLQPYNSGYAENVATTFFEITPTRAFIYTDIEVINEINDQAKDIALIVFNMWKNSSGHNANMLQPNNNSHATSFLINNGSVYATSLFVSDAKCVHKYSLEIPNQFNNDTDETFDYNDKLNNVLTCDINPTHSEFKYFSILTEFFSSKSIEPNKNLYEIVKNNEKLQESNLRKLYLKKTKYTSIFKLKNKDITFLTHTIHSSLTDFNNLKLASQLDEFIAKHTSLFNKTSEWGGTTILQINGENVVFITKILILHDK
jgi:uncharacterized protein YkwD